jgi:hypothetical protein
VIRLIIKATVQQTKVLDSPHHSSKLRSDHNSRYILDEVMSLHSVVLCPRLHEFTNGCMITAQCTDCLQSGTACQL